MFRSWGLHKCIIKRFPSPTPSSAVSSIFWWLFITPFHICWVVLSSLYEYSCIQQPENIHHIVLQALQHHTETKRVSVSTIQKSKTDNHPYILLSIFGMRRRRCYCNVLRWEMWKITRCVEWNMCPVGTSTHFSLLIAITINSWSANEIDSSARRVNFHRFHHRRERVKGAK